MGGALIEIAKPFPPENGVWVHIQHRGTWHLDIPAIIVHVTRVSNREQDGVGIEWLDLNDEQEELIQELVREISESPKQ